MNKQHKPIRHGECLLLPVDSIPAGKTRLTKNMIVAHSETSHHHVLESKADFEVMAVGEKQELYLRLFKPAKLVHKKQLDAHKTLTVKPGVYKVVHKTEYNPWEGIISRVFD